MLAKILLDEKVLWKICVCSELHGPEDQLDAESGARNFLRKFLVSYARFRKPEPILTLLLGVFLFGAFAASLFLSNNL